MEDRTQHHPPFDERRALEELERLRAQIELRKSERKAVKAEFERFVGSFKARREAPAPAPAPAPAMAPPVPSESLALAPAVLTEPPPILPVTSGPVASEPVASEPPPPAPAPSSSRSASKTWGLRGGALILIVAGGLAAWTLRNRAPEPDPRATPASATPSPASTPPAEAAAAPAQAPVPAAEITTTRRVWMRVLVDGERVLEREMPANSRVPLAAQKAIVIRAGDAGAVRLSIRGVDQGFLGREGTVVTRTFAVPPPPGR